MCMYVIARIRNLCAANRIIPRFKHILSAFNSIADRMDVIEGQNHKCKVYRQIHLRYQVTSLEGVEWPLSNHPLIQRAIRSLTLRYPTSSVMHKSHFPCTCWSKCAREWHCRVGPLYRFYHSITSTGQLLPALHSLSAFAAVNSLCNPNQRGLSSLERLLASEAHPMGTMFLLMCPPLGLVRTKSPSPPSRQAPALVSYLTQCHFFLLSIARGWVDD